VPPARENMADRETQEARRAALARVDERQRDGDLDEGDARAVREELHEALTAKEVRTICEDYFAPEREPPDWGDPGVDRREPVEGVLNALGDIHGPATAGEVAEELGVTYRRARSRLEDLEQEGVVERKIVAGRIRIWWPTETNSR
jgi:hypothetical protein